MKWEPTRSSNLFTHNATFSDQIRWHGASDEIVRSAWLVGWGEETLSLEKSQISIDQRENGENGFSFHYQAPANHNHQGFFACILHILILRNCFRNSPFPFACAFENESKYKKVIKMEISSSWILLLLRCDYRSSAIELCAQGTAPAPK